MAVKSGSFVHDVHGFVIDRIQTGGVSNLNVPVEKIQELGNWQTVANIRDIPDLSFDLESLDVSTEIESVLLFKDPTTAVNGDEFDFTKAVPTDVISPFKADRDLYNIVNGIVVPSLTLEQATYRFGVTANATQAFTLRGDSIYYTPGSPYYQQYVHDGTTAGYAIAHAGIPYRESGNTIHVLSLCAVLPDGTYKRLFFGADYTDTTTGFTLTNPTAYPNLTVLRATYGSTVAATYPQSVHQDVTVKPAAVRGKDIDVYIGAGPIRTFTGTTTATNNVLVGTFTAADVGAAVSGTGIPAGTTITTYTDPTHAVMSANATASGTPTVTLTPPLSRWTSIQSFESTWRVTLDANREFGNQHYVSQDYDTPDVTGNFVVRPRDPGDLFAKINTIANVATNEVAGVLSSVGLPLEARIRHPDTGAVLKTIYIPEARIQTPNVQGRVGQKIESTFNLTSDTGRFFVYMGTRAA